MRRAIPILILAAVLSLLLVPAAPAAFAQCAMCRTAAGAVNPDGQKAMNLAILVLLLPATSIFGAVIFWAVRKRNDFRDDAGASYPAELRENIFLHSSRR